MERYPRDFNWDALPKARRLSEYDKADPYPGVYELGWYLNGKFEAMYGGRSAVSVKQRLQDHYKSSHNRMIKEHVDMLYFRYKIFSATKLALYVEAVSIKGFNYQWNMRNEWRKMWALET